MAKQRFIYLSSIEMRTWISTSEIETLLAGRERTPQASVNKSSKSERTHTHRERSVKSNSITRGTCSALWRHEKTIKVLKLNQRHSWC